MMTLLSLILLLAVILAWQGKRKPAMYAYVGTLVFATLVFIHHISDTLLIEL